MKSSLSKLTTLLTLSVVLLFSEAANAYTLGANQIATIGSSGLYYTFNAISGAKAGRTYVVQFNTSGTMQTGNLTNGGTLIDTVAFNVALNSASIAEYVSGNPVTQTGSLTGNISMSLNNVSLNQGANQAAAISGTATSSALFSISGTVNGENVVLTSTPISLNYMDFTAGQFSGAYDTTIAAFGGGTVRFGLDIDGNAQVTHSWTSGSGTILFNSIASVFNFGGDLHTSLALSSAPVPEPATMALILSGILGGAFARRKSA